MAFPSTGVNGKTMVDALNNVINLTPASFKVALFTDSVTGSDKNASEAYGSGAWASNEASGTGYTAGGIVIPTCTFSTPASGVTRLQSGSASVEWTTATFTARGAVVYDPTASSRVVCVINFGANKEVAGSTFTLEWDSIDKICKLAF